MPLPPFNEFGDLPDGVHRASLTELIARSGGDTEQRREVTGRLERIYRLAVSTGALERFVVFGSYITAKAEPNDVDVVLVMRDDFDLTTCPAECRPLFDHRRAALELGASCFWVRPGLLFGEPLDSFIAGWGVRREGGRRGIVEVTDDP
jgi:hypothetical protein